MIRLFTRTTPLSDYLSAIRQIQANAVKAQTLRVIYAEPERDEFKPQCVHIYTDADILALELKREREEAAQPKNVRKFVRGIQ